MNKQRNNKHKGRKESDRPEKKQEKKYNKAGILIEGQRKPRRKFINGEEV